MKKLPFRKSLRFIGPDFIVTVGYIDPGNWATNIEGESKFGYQLLWVIILSTFMLIIIQQMAAKLGIAIRKSLAVNIRENFSFPVSSFMGITRLCNSFCFSKKSAGVAENFNLPAPNVLT